MARPPRATETTAQLTVSDWDPDEPADGPFGPEQAFNLLELQPDRESGAADYRSSGGRE